MRAADLEASPHFSAPDLQLSAASGLIPALLGLLLGNALQLQQAALWSSGDYLIGLVVGLLLLGLSLRVRSTPWRKAFLGVAFVVLAFASTGWRAQVFGSQALAPAFEGRDIAVTGVVAAMPQHFEGGVRFRLDLENASLDGQPLRLPTRLELANANTTNAAPSKA